MILNNNPVLGFFTQNIGKLTLFDCLLVVSYLILCLVIGVRKFTKIKNIREYALGIGDISTVALVATIYATYLGAGASISMLERISAIGMLFAVTVLLRPIIMWPIYSFVFGRNIEQFRGCITPGDIMNRLYG